VWLFQRRVLTILSVERNLCQCCGIIIGAVVDSILSGRIVDGRVVEVDTERGVLSCIRLPMAVITVVSPLFSILQRESFAAPLPSMRIGFSPCGCLPVSGQLADCQYQFGPWVRKCLTIAVALITVRPGIARNIDGVEAGVAAWLLGTIGGDRLRSAGWRASRPTVGTWHCYEVR
jgi:hypothetical protein